MKDFKFQEFSIKQDKRVFRVGTDAVLLGALSNPYVAKKALEIGTGTGIISLMLAQRFPQMNILGIDVNPIAIEIASENFSKSKFSKQLTTCLIHFYNLSTTEKFDFIFSNPPYFEMNSSDKDKMARQQCELNFYGLIKKTSTLLSPKGYFSIIIPHESSDLIIYLAKKYHLFLVRKINILGVKNGKIKRNILEFSFKNQKAREENFTIEESPRKYSKEYLEATKLFHCF